MHGIDFGTEVSVPHKKCCRPSKKKRLRLKKRASLEPAVGVKSDNQDNVQKLPTNQHKGQNRGDFQDIQGKQVQQRISDLTPIEQQYYQLQDQDEKQDGHRSGDAGQEKQVQDEMTEYERKRQENILRNQAFLQKVGVSTAKFAARTTIGNEAEKEEKRKEMAARRALSAARKAELLSQPVRKSKRLQSEKVVVKARSHLLKLMTKSVGTKPLFLREVAENENDQANRNQDQNQYAAPAVRTEAENEAKQKEMASRRSSVSVKKAGVLNRPMGKPSRSRSENVMLKPMVSEKVVVKPTVIRRRTGDRPGMYEADAANVKTTREQMRNKHLSSQKAATRHGIQATAEVRHNQARTAEKHAAEKEARRQKLSAKPFSLVHVSQQEEILSGPIRTTEIHESKKKIGSMNSLSIENAKQVGANKLSVQHQHVDSCSKTAQTSLHKGENTEIHPQSDLEKKDANQNINKQALDQDEQEVVTEYERRRQENILRNQTFLKQVGVSTAKVAACAALGNEAAKEAKRQELASKRARKASRRTELLKQPVRKSRRLSGEKAVVSEPDGLDYSMDLLSMKTTRLNCTGKVHVMDVIDEEGKTFCQENIGGFHERGDIEQALVLGDAGDDVEYTLDTNDIVKTVPYRITAMAFLPRADRIVVACGDKEGLVSLWSPANSTTSCSSSAAMYRPHGYPVTQLIFPTSSTLISSSMDGTVCEFDLWSSKTSLVCDISYETGITSLAQSGNPQFYYASCDDGTLRLIDRRARNLYSGGFSLHKGKINTVDQHPTLDYCIATAGQDLNVCFWDKRKIGSERNIPIANLRHRSERHCAQFSQHDGAWLVTLGYESFIDMYDTSNLIKCKTSDTPSDMPNPVRTPHNNYTGTSTKFRPAWDPKRPNRFVIGCWEQPSRLQILRAGHARPIRELVRGEATNISFDVVTQYHPYLDLIASGNSAGRLSLWRAKNK